MTMLSTALWPAFTLGLLGGLHCIGMCGPLQLLVAKQAPGLGAAQLVFQGSRIAIYALMGLVAGWLGRLFDWSGLSTALSIALGVALLLFQFGPRWFRILEMSAARLTGSPFFQSIWRKTASRPLVRHALLGSANGLLPCGLVIAALAMTASAAAPLGGALMMAVFGAGTLPALLVVGFFGRLIAPVWRRKLALLKPAGVALVAALLILRGLGLMPHLPWSGQDEKKGCCHHAVS